MILPSLIFFALITTVAPILGRYIAWVFHYGFSEHEALKNNRGYWKSQNWKEYFGSLMSFNIICILCTFIIIYFQQYFPTYSEAQSKISLSSSINAAISFSTGTFWQSHNPGNELSMFSHIFAITMQNFLSGATGIAVFIAFIRGIINSQNPYIGNFYDDFLRSMIFILLPISTVIAITLISYGTPYDFTGNIEYIDIVGHHNYLNIGPVAGQVAIKNLVANGGSLFASASAHPFEAPSREAIMLNLFLIVLMPVAMIFAYGYLVDVRSLSWALYAVVIIIMIFSLLIMNLGETTYGLPLIFGKDTLVDYFNYTCLIF